MDVKVKDPMSKYMVLMDFSEPALKALKYAVSIAGICPVHIHVFHVINTDGADEYELNIHNVVTPKVEDAIKKMDSIVDIISSAGISVSYDVSYGEELSELKEQLQKEQPDVVVAAKRNKKEPNRLLDYLINEYNGTALVHEMDFMFSAKSNMAICYNSHTVTDYYLDPILNLSKAVESNIQLLHVVKNSYDSIESMMRTLKNLFRKEAIIESSLLVNKSIQTGLSIAANQKQTELLVMGRGEVSTSFFKSFLNQRKLVNALIKEIKTPILILGKSKNKNSNGHG